MHYEVSIIVKAPREKVYSAYTDFGAAPKWSRQKIAVKVSRKEGNRVFLERASEAGGPSAVREVDLFPPERVESESESRFSRTRSVVRFAEAPDGTEVTATLDVQLKGRWSWILRPHGRVDAEASATEELASFAKYVESLP